MDRRQFLVSAALATVAPATLDTASAKETPPTSKPVKTSGVGKDVVWHDVRDWGIEGKGFADTESYFDRLPARAKGVVRDAVWNLSRDTSGMAVFFETDATDLYVRYTVLKPDLAMAHMPATGVSGLDLYGMSDKGWRYINTQFPRAQQTEAKLIAGLAPGQRAYHINLPLYNGVTSLEIGVAKDAKFVPTPPRKDKPVVFYGTSITQGGCASRPGMSFTNILRRRLNVPVLNFGFSGNGRTEIEVGRFLVELDAAIFVLDTSANTAAEELTPRTEALVKLIRERHKSTPILLLDERKLESGPFVPSVAERNGKQVAALKQAYDNLLAAGITDLHFRGGADVIGDDHEGTVDGSHPTDLGMMRYADAIGPDIAKLIKSI